MRFPWFEDDSDLRRPCWRPPLAGVVVLRRTTLFRGGFGLGSLLITGDDGREDGSCALPARTLRLVSRCLRLSLPKSRSSGTDEVDAARALLLVVTRDAGRGGGDDGRSLAMGGAADDASDACPSSSSAFVSALNFIGTGISSSELSLSVEYCCDCDRDSLSSEAVVADPPIGFDSLRLNCDLDVGRRRACLADVLRPRDVKWLPTPIGVGDAADILLSQSVDVCVLGAACRAGMLN